MDKVNTEFSIFNVDNELSPRDKKRNSANRHGS